MFQYTAAPEGSFRQFRNQRVSAPSLLPAVSLVAGLTLGAGVEEAHATKSEPFKEANVHFETNASGCDMGIQMFFDTEGVTTLSVEDPNDDVIYSVEVTAGMADIGGQTEGFLEGVEPQIDELLAELGCEPSDEGEPIPLAELFAAFPAGKYEFEGQGGGATFEGSATLTHNIPAGPEITAPLDGTVVSANEDLLIEWEEVTDPILPGLGPVDIVGYHIVVAAIGQSPAQLDIDVAEDVFSVTVPEQFLEPGTVYEFEVLATDKGGNQTITEGGAVCTEPITQDKCFLP